jgi:hypothetical protein
MKKKALCLVGALLLAGPALAQPKPAAPAAPPAAGATPPAGGMPDMTKMGPMSRPVTKQDKKGVADLYKAMDAAMKAGDVNAAADLVDFPVIMLTDDSTGTVQHFNATRDQWVGMMTPMMAQAKDVKHSAKHTPYFLSDTLAVSIEDISMTAGKTKGKWKAMSVLTLKDGKWKFKQMAEAGWGDMKPPTTAATK